MIGAVSIVRSTLTFDPATELTAALAPCMLLDAVPQAPRDRLEAAVAALPDEGLGLAWYRLAEASRHWIAANNGRRLARRFDEARHLLEAAVADPPAPTFSWQERFD